MFYVFSVVGVALSIHFCGGRLASVSFSSAKTGCKLCKLEPVAKKGGDCCKNTKIEVKVKDSHQTTNGVNLFKVLAVKLFHLPKNIHFSPVILIGQRAKRSNKAPPRGLHIAVYLLNCVFRN